MAKDPLGETPIELKCPECGKEFNKKLARLDSDRSATCPACHLCFAVDVKQFRRIRDELKKIFD